MRPSHARASLAQLYAKSRMGWRETVVNQHESQGSGAIVVHIAKADANL
jgi:hypothetical protein